jgi:tetratricopeptide (TPR) repeat protein
MASVRTIASGMAACLVVGLVGCGRSTREAAPVEPPVPTVEDEPGSWVSVARVDPMASEDDVARARMRLELALADGDAAEQVRARFALAETCAGAAVRLLLARVELDEERLAGPAGPRPDLEPRDAELAAQQQAWRDAAATEYAEVLRSTDPAAVELRPRARYGLAEIQRGRGEHEAAHDSLVALVHDDPAHPLAAAALVQLADEAFAAGRLEESRALYEQVLVHRTDERHYARYKLGWIALNLDDGAAALAHFTAVIGEAGANPRYRTLVENAARDCVLAYARVGRPERARDFFARLDPPNAEKLVQRLARIYEDEGRPEDAARALGLPRK